MGSNRRRRKTSAFEDLVELVALLPWWVGVVLAVASYLMLSAFAKRPLPATAQLGQLGEVMTGSMLRALALAGQYFLPVICVLGAAVSAWKRRERAALAKQAAGPNAAQAIDGMSWREFELLVGEAYRLRGYRVQETGGGGADGGVDLVLAKDSETWLVQCKQWRAQMVGVDIVRQLYGVMAARGATGGFVVTSGCFSDDAVRFAKGRNVELVDGSALQQMLVEAKKDVQRPQAAAPQPAAKAAVATASPQCSGPMVQRTATRGANVGTAFWGCAAYPKCRGTRTAA